MNDAAPAVEFAATKDTVQPGTSVKRGDQTMALSKGGFKLGDTLPPIPLAGAGMKPFTIAANGRPKILSIVPSVDTKVCEEQTHILGETLTIDPKVELITISRDLPFAQQRFASEANLQKITYLSDYKAGEFGKKTGLYIEENGLLARAVVVLDGEGKVRYFQVVPDIATLPDMAAAISEANKLAGAK
jgi:thiol peroxidase